MNRWFQAITALSAVGFIGLVGAGCGSSNEPESFSGSSAELGSATLVNSQVYGGGGNSGATYKNDFIELFNRSSNPVDLTGWSVQYNSATGTGGWSGKTPLSGTIPAGGYFLVQEAQGGAGTINLPTPD